MLSSALLLGLLGLATAAPTAEYKTSSGFKLVIKLCKDTSDFTPPIDGSFVASIHTGAARALVGVSSEDNARLFYQNGTSDEYKEGRATIITDGGTPLTPAGLSFIQDDESTSLATAHLDFGFGTPGVQVATQGGHVVVQTPSHFEMYLACDEPLEYYQGKKFVIIKRIRYNKDGTTKDVPKECVPVYLVPQCAKIEDLPAGSYASHEYLIDSKCYSDVSKVEW